MTQQPFSRPGAIDLSGLGRPPAPQQAAPAAGTGSASGAAGGAYSVAITQDNFQQVLQESMTAPVVMVFHSAQQAPGSEQYAADVIATPYQVEDPALAATKLSEILPTSREEIEEALSDPEAGFAYIAHKVSLEEADRVEALHGSLFVRSPAGAGTHLRAEIPCA